MNNAITFLPITIMNKLFPHGADCDTEFFLRGGMEIFFGWVFNLYFVVIVAVLFWFR